MTNETAVNLDGDLLRILFVSANILTNIEIMSEILPTTKILDHYIMKVKTTQKPFNHFQIQGGCLFGTQVKSSSVVSFISFKRK